MEELFSMHSLIALLTLTTLEIVLGIDNVVFIAILSGKLPKEKQRAARRWGLALAALGRIVLLFAITWVMTLKETIVFTVFEHGVTAKDIILIVGGAFLLGKGTWEIHHTLEGGRHDADANGPPKASFFVVICQILALDAVFSIDSVLTAVGMVRPEDYTALWPALTVMVTAVVLSIIVMLIFTGPLSRFIEQHPTMKVLALSFLLLIGIVLIAEGLHQHIPRGYIYFGMGFSLFVELLNLRVLSKRRGAKRAAAEQAAHG